MNTDETIRTFIEFFRDRGHRPIEGSSLLSRPGAPVLSGEDLRGRLRLPIC